MNGEEKEKVDRTIEFYEQQVSMLQHDIDAYLVRESDAAIVVVYLTEVLGHTREALEKLYQLRRDIEKQPNSD